MKEVKVMKRYKCDFCKRRSIKSVMELHERRCFRNPNRFCDYCENQGFTMDTILENYPEQKTPCPYCSQRDLEKEKAISKWETKREDDARAEEAREEKIANISNSCSPKIVINRQHRSQFILVVG